MGFLAPAISVTLTAAAAIAGAAYFFWLTPGHGPAGTTQVASAAPAKKDEGKGKGRGGASAPVTAATVVEADMPVILSAPGTVEPLANVAVKPRVDGQIVEVAFSEGDMVEQGSVLFRLDDRMVKAQIAQAEANVAKEEASLRDAEATLARRQALIDKQVVTEAALDQARYAVDGLKAGIAAGRALLDTLKDAARLSHHPRPDHGAHGQPDCQAGRHRPHAGGDGARHDQSDEADPGQLLSAAARAVRRAASALLQGHGASDGAGTAAHRRCRATIASSTTRWISTTGAIVVEGQTENADEVLWPGQSVEVALTVEVKQRMMSAPATAVLPAQQGMITWVIGADNKVTPRVVTVERIVGQTVFLSSGVAAGDRVVTDGQLRLAPGATVTIEEPRRAPDKSQDKKALDKAPGKAQVEDRRANGRG